MEFLTSKKAQGIYANVNNEYPIDPNVKASPLLESWGKFPRDTDCARHDRQEPVRGPENRQHGRL